jgi:protease I
MSNELKGKKIAMLVTNGFEQVELTEPRKALREAGAAVEIVSLKKDAVKAWNHKDWGEEFEVDVHIDAAKVDEYDALVLPGGVMNPDFLRLDSRAVDFVSGFTRSGKPVAAICHAPWTLIEADVVRDRRMTSYPSLRTDLTNAGARWVDEPVVVDRNLITSRRPDDLPAFCQVLITSVALRDQPPASASAADV